MKILWVITLWLYMPLVGDDGWKEFAKTRFNETFYKKYNEYFLKPTFAKSTQAMAGKEFTLKGHYLALDYADKKNIILSKYPMAQCFFCGAAGPESIVEVTLTEKPPRLKPDQVITITGILKLNDSDVEHMNFLLVNAEIVVK